MQQINLIICQEQEQVMVNSIFGFKDQKCGIQLGKMKSCSLNKNKAIVKDNVLSKYKILIVALVM